LLTIAMIAIAAIVLAGIARQSLLLAMECLEAQEDLQRRWGAATCQQAVLDRADDILKKRADDLGESSDASEIPPDQVAAKVVLGGIVFNLLLADEDAKVSHNTIYRWRSEQEVNRVVQESAESSGGAVVRLRPFRSDTSRQDQHPTFDSWGQVFELGCTGRNRISAEQVADATTGVTCWGRGRLNAYRAPNRRIERICGMVIEPAAIDRLLELRRQYFANKQPKGPLAADHAKPAESGASGPAAMQSPQEQNAVEQEMTAMLDGLHLRDSERERLGQLLACRSTCHSLWITMTAKDRMSSSFTVLDSTGHEKLVSAHFTW
jgi:hypothetical protein